MKKIIITTSATLLALTSFANAQEAAEKQEFFFKPEVGIDYSYGMVNIDSDYDNLYGDDVNNLHVSLGARIHKNVGFELDMSKSSKAKKDLGSVSTEFEYKSIGLNANFYLPVTEKAEAFAAAGVGYYDFDSKAFSRTSSASYSDSVVSPRIGAGMQYKLNENFAIKSSVNHVFVDDKDIDSLTDVKVGLRYSF